MKKSHRTHDLHCYAEKILVNLEKIHLDTLNSRGGVSCSFFSFLFYFFSCFYLLINLFISLFFLNPLP